MPSYVRAGIRKCARIRALSALDAGEVISPKLITENDGNGNDSNDEEKQHDEEN